MATPTTLPAAFTAGQVLTAAQMNDLRGAFRVLQVGSTTKTDTFTTSSASFVDVTGLTVSITPSSTTSKVLVIVDTKLGGSNTTTYPGVQLLRDSTDIYTGDAAGSRVSASFGANIVSIDTLYSVGLAFLDSPNTTSATTYKIQARSNSGAMYVNRTFTDTSSTAFYRVPSSITVMEISA
jgi:hypothetical protein